MILVEYYPKSEHSVLPNNGREYEFTDVDEFLEWVQKYVCIYCLIDFRDTYDANPLTLSDWLEFGCGCEIGITDTKQEIDWDYHMTLPANFEKKYEPYRGENYE